MSDEHVSDATPEATSAEENSSPVQSLRTRHPLERILVWGLIATLVALVCWEGTARFGYRRTLSRFQQELRKDEGAHPDSLSLDEADRLVSGFPQQSQAKGKVLSLTTYRWQGLLKNHGGIHLAYDTQDRVVTALYTDQTLAEENAAREAALEQMRQAGWLK